MRKSFIFFILLPFLLVFLFSVSSFSKELPKLKVMVSILPQKYFLERIGGDYVSIVVMVPPAASPATYEPKPSQMKYLNKASLYFAIGVPFEKIWLKRFLKINPRLNIVYTQEGIKLYPISGHSENNHHGNEILDPHIWLSPPLVAMQARNILVALIKALPDAQDVFKNNYKAFLQEIVKLDTELMTILGPLWENKRKSRAFMVFHPSWGYFARAYGLKQIPIEEEGKAPKPFQLVRLTKLAKKFDVKVIFVQPQFSQRHAEIIAKTLGVDVVIADPLAYRWSENLKDVAKKMGNYLK